MHGTLELFNWTASRTQDLQRMITEGYSGSQAAHELGITRNAAIGKATRLGIHFNSRPGQLIDRPRAPQLRSEPSVRSTPRVRVRVVTRAPLPPMAPEPESRNLTFAQLKANDCRYPVTADSPFLFCGQQKQGGSSYCAHHHHKCWTPPRSR